MRIAQEQIDIPASLGLNKRTIIGEMQQLFGGTMRRMPGHGLIGGLRAHRLLEAADILAVTNAVPEAVSVYPELSTPTGVAAWTALQAYLAKGGVPLTRLSVETSGRPGRQEWIDQKSPELNQAIQEAEAMYFSAKIMTGGDSHAAKAADQEFIERIREPLQAAGSPNFFATRSDPASRTRSLADWHSTTIFHALGDGLPEAVQVMAEGYGELIADQSEAATQVAHALGASSLAGLTEAWSWAQTQETQLAAGYSMFRALTVENY